MSPSFDLEMALHHAPEGVETLQEAGVPEIQAKAISKAVRNAYDTAEPVTKTDLREAVSELRGETQTLGADLRSEIQRLDSKLESLNAKFDSKIDKLGLQLTIRLGGLVVVAVGTLMTLSKWGS